ncbi:MAG: hypothetical protein HY236_09105 [Acidobacteria bacterium]|nr:hypothetical protein [Acidobacteriota bacterium]
MQNSVFSFLRLAVCFLGAAALLFPQGTNLGTIRGTVTDITGAVVPSARV